MHSLASLRHRFLSVGFALVTLSARADVARFPALRLADGTVLPAHASASGDLSDTAAATRRLEILRSPYTQPEERRSFLEGRVTVGFGSAVSVPVRQRISRGLAAALTTILDGDGSHPFSAANPLQVLIVRAAEGTPASAGWERRDHGQLVHPVAFVPARSDATAVLLDAVHQVAVLALRQAAPEESPWIVEGLAEFWSRRALERLASPSVDSDVFLHESGTLTDPATAALFLSEIVSRLPGGLAELRAAWAIAGASPGDDAEAFLRDLASRCDSRGLSVLLADLLTRRLADAGGAADGSSVSSGLVLGEALTASPEPLGWRRLTLHTLDERGGLEVLLPDDASGATGRVLLFYRGAAGEFDAVGLVPGRSCILPLSGSTQLNLLLVDGAEAQPLSVELRRVPDYPVSLSSWSAEWREGSVHVAWRTSAHRDLLAFVLVRLEERADGSLVELSREIVPTSDGAAGVHAYDVADTLALEGHRYRYRVFALTRGGFLSETFAASVRAGR